MTIYTKLQVGSSAAAAWDDTGILWDDTAVIWDGTEGGSSAVNDAITIELNRTIGDNNGSSRLTATFHNHNGRNATNFAQSDNVVLYADQDVNPPTTMLFNGIVTELKFTGKGSNKEKLILTARDYTALLQKNTIEPEVYTNKEISFIVTDIMTKYGPTGLTFNNVQNTGVTLDRIVFKQDNIFDALKKLAELADNWFFYVDSDKDLHFEKKGTTSSGVELNNTNTYESDFRESGDNVKNRVYVYGDRQLIAVPTENFTADGAGSVFTLEFPPHNTKVAVSGVQKKGAIFQGNAVQESGPDFLVNFHDQQIIFISGTDLGYTSVPASGVAVDIDYFRERPIIKLARDTVSIAQHGERTDVIIDKSIQDPQLARDIAVSQVNLQKNPPVQGNCKVQGIISPNPGETIDVELPNKNQSGKTYDIIEARYIFTTENNFKEKVLSLRVSRRIKNVADVLKDLILAQRRAEAATINETDILSRLELFAGSYAQKSPAYRVKSRAINDSFILGHPINGVLGEVGSPHGGTLSAGSLTWVSGLIGLLYDKAVSFDGGSIVIANSPMGADTTQGAISMWGKLVDTSANYNLIYRAFGNSLYPRIRVDNGGAPRAQYRLDGSTRTITSSLSVNAGEAFHVVLTMHNSSGAFLYVNGSLTAQNTDTGTDFDGGTSQPVIGFDSNLTNRMNGVIDDVRIYNKFLNPAEIGSLYAGLNYPAGSLIGYWTLDEGSGNRVYSSASGNSYKLQPLLGDRRADFIIVQSGGTT